MMKVTDLIKLGQKALKIFDEYIAEEHVEPPMRVYVRHFHTEFEISETSNKGSSSSEIIRKPFWVGIVYDFMEKKIKPMPEFAQLAQSIAKKYKQNILTIAPTASYVNQSVFWLEMFIQRLIYESLDGSLSEDSLIEYASLFMSELELTPTEYKYVDYLDGLFLEMDRLVINDNVLIRKVQKSDLEYERDISFDMPSPQYMSIGLPSSIMETTISSRDERECYGYKSRIFNSLRMYKLGTIYSKETRSTKRTVIWPMGVGLSSGTRRPFAFRQYTVKKPEADSFVNFVNAIEQKLNFDKEAKKFRSLHISIERYNSALLESVGVDRKLMTTVMGLESLFTLEKDRGENAFKLGIRVAKLLGHLGFDTERVRALVEESYNFRNKVVHGSYISQEGNKRMSEILPYILDYLRVSLIIFIFSQGTGKDKIIEMIDKSTVSDIRDRELKKVLEKNTKEFSDMLVLTNGKAPK